MAIPTLGEAVKNYQDKHKIDQTQQVQNPPQQSQAPQQQPQQQPQPQSQPQQQPANRQQAIAQYVAQQAAQQQPQSDSPYTTEVPQNVIDAQAPASQINIASQDYADEMTSRIIRDRNGYLADDNYQGMLNKTYTLQTYDYIKRANNGADDTAWKRPNPEDDLYSKWLPEWIKAQDLERQAKEAYDKRTDTLDYQNKQITDIAYRNTTSKAQREIMNAANMEHGNWNLLSWWDKAKYLLVPGSSATTMDDSPDWAKYIQNIFPSVMAGGAGALVGSLIPVPFAGLVTGAIVGGLAYLQGVTDIEIPVINKLLEGLDILSVWTEQGQGALGAAMSEAKNQLQGKDAGLLDFVSTTVDVLKENPHLLEVGKYAYEVSADFGFDDLLLFVRNTGAKVSDALLGTNFGQRDISDVSRANIGRGGLEEVMEGTQGYQSLYSVYLPVFDGLVDAAMQQGMTKKDAFEFAHANMEQYLVNYMGTSGLTRDLVASSIADPQNLIPFVSAKTAEGVGKSMVDRGKATGNMGLQQSGLALQNAGKAAVGNPVIDMLPPVVQQVAEAVTGKHGSQGFDTIQQVYKQNLRGMVDVDNLSGWQKHFAGIDKEGKIGEYDTFKSTGNPVVDWFKRMVTVTDETKMFDLQQMSTDFLGSVFFDADTPTYMIPDLIEQATGRKPITADSPLAPFQNTAVMNTLREMYSTLDDAAINTIKQDVLNYRQFKENRAMVDYVAQQLGMTADEVFDALDNKGIDPKDPKYREMSKRERKAALDSERQELFGKIREANLTFTDADGKVISTNKIIKDINVFKKQEGGNNTVGRKQYSQTYLKASILENIANTVDNYNLARYGIKPDSWAVRMSNLAKSMQSIALLNFSTSYQVNNFLNNMLTRSVVGVGGFDPDFINTVNAKRGLFFSRDSDAFEGTKNATNRAKKATDTLQKFDDMYKKATDCKLLKGVNNLDVEGTETTAAFNIGANRYWSATWGNNIPDMPDSWRAVGITDDMKQTIFKLALDSSNMDEFRANLMGDVVLPKAMSTLDQMVANSYDDKSAKIIRDFFATKPWITDMVDAFMETGDERLISRGFDKLMNDICSDIGLENLVETQSTFESLRNTYADQGIGAAATAFEALNNLYSQIWIKQTKENGTLFLDRIVGAIAEPDFDTKYETITKLQTADYNIARGYTIMNIGALIDGIGMNDDAGIGLISSAMAFYDISEEYIKARHDIYQQYGKRGTKTYDFPRYRAETIDACTKALNAQLEATKNMHQVMVDYLRSNLDEGWTGHIDNFARDLENVVKLKEADNKAEIKDLTQRINAQGKKQRAHISWDQERPRVERKKQISQAYTQSAQTLKAMEGAMPKDTAKTKTMSFADTLKAEMLYEEATGYSDKSSAFLKKWQKGADPSKVFEPVNYENTNVKTSFYEYGQQRIINEAIRRGSDAAEDAAAIQSRFYEGGAVPLGAADVVHAKNVGDAVYIPETKTLERLVMTDHFELLNPKADVKSGEYVVARSKPWMFGDQTVNAGVYHNGQLIGYITAGMEETVVVDGKTYPILGVSKKNPNTMLVMVQDKVREVTAGKPEGVNYSIYARENFHPGGIDTTPTIEPCGRAGLESSAGIRQAISLWKDQALSDLHKAQTNGSVYGKLNDAQRVAVFEWMDGDLRQAFNSQRYQTQRYAETMVDAALLNYNRRYGFDNLLTMISPYQFWMTRSVANWGKRMISQPAWFSMYARLEKLIEKNKKDFLPTRLEGWVGLPMPNMGDGMGSSWFFDIAPTVFPFQQFYKATDYFMKNINTIHQNTLTRIDEMHSNGDLWNNQPVTDDMYYEAMQGKGDLYWAIYNDEKDKDESDVSAGGLMGTFFGPPVWFDVLRKHLSGKDKDISYSPMYRLGNMVKATGDDTWFEDLTNVVGGALQMPENALRRMAGIESNPDGNYADYGIISNIANMLTDNEISLNDARNAIVEGEGNEIYDTALYRYRQTQAYRQQGGALATEIGQFVGGNKSTSAGQLAGSALVSLFGAKVLPDGERTHREQQALYRKIVASGDKEAYSKFWDEFPEYSVHNYSYEDDPDKRLHRVLLDNLKSAYYSLPEAQQTAAQRALGDRFNRLFVNKDTRAYDYLDENEMIEWTRALQGNVPNFTNEQITGPMDHAMQVNWYVDSVQADYDRFQRDFDRKFPAYDVVEEGYYAIPQEMRAKYLVDNPMLQQAWDWRDKAIQANPRLAVYLNDRSAQYKVNKGQYDNITDALMSKLNSWTLSQLKNHMQYGWKINPKAEATLRSVYTSLMTNVPYETWKASLVK